MEELKEKYERMMYGIKSSPVRPAGYTRVIEVADCLADMIDEVYNMAQAAHTASIGVYEEVRKVREAANSGLRMNADADHALGIAIEANERAGHAWARADSAHARIDELDPVMPPGYHKPDTCRQCRHGGYITRNGTKQFWCMTYKRSVGTEAVCASFERGD